MESGSQQPLLTSQVLVAEVVRTTRTRALGTMHGRAICDRRLVPKASTRSGSLSEFQASVLSSIALPGGALSVLSYDTGNAPAGNDRRHAMLPGGDWTLLQILNLFSPPV